MSNLNKVYNIAVDIKNVEGKYSSYAKFFDDDRDTSIIRIKLLNDNYPIDLEGCTVEAEFILANNTYHDETCKIINTSEGIVELQLCQECKKGLYSDNPDFNDDPLTPVLSQMLLDVKVTKANQIELQERYEKSLPKIESKLKEADNAIDRVNNAIASGTQDLEVKDARVDKNGKSYAKLGDRLNEVDSQLEHNTNLLEYRNGYVSVKEYGAKGDGITDDTEAINNAISQNSSVILPPGKYLISSPIFIGYKKEIKGFGDSTIITTNVSTDIFHVGYRCVLDGFRVETWSCPEYNSNIITVNDLTLREWINSEGNAALKTRIKNISVRSGNSGVDSSVITLSMTNKINGKFDGFFDVILDNISNVGYDNPIQYFLRSFCKNNLWITGVTLSNCVNQHTVWGIFDGENDIDLNDPEITSCIDQFNIYNYQHQCDYTTKAYAYIRNGKKRFNQCMPWDWQYATGVHNNRPYLINENISIHSKPQIPYPSTADINMVTSNGDILGLNWNELNKLYRLAEMGNTHNLTPKIIGLGISWYNAERNDRKAVLIYRGAANTFTSNNNVLIFSYRNLDTLGWNNITIRYDGNGGFNYTSSLELPSRLEFRFLKDDNNIDIYICGSEGCRGVDQMDIIKTEPMTNDMVSYSGNSQFTNYYRTPNVFTDEYKTNIEGLILVTKKA